MTQCRPKHPCGITIVKSTLGASCGPRNNSVEAVQIAEGSALFIDECGKLDVKIDCCDDCKFTWQVNPANASVGSYVQFTAAGLRSKQKVSVVFQNGQYYKDYTFQADSSGIVSNESILLVGPPGMYVVRPTAENCTPDPFSSAISVSANVQTACSGNVTITPSFSKMVVTEGGQVNLVLKVQNTNNNAVTVNMSQITLPANLTTTTPVLLQNEVVPANSYILKTWTLDATNPNLTDSVQSLLIPSGAGSYVCGNDQYNAGGGTASTTVTKTPAPACGLVIQSFTAVPSSITSGQSATLKLVLKNTGTTLLTNIQYPGFQLSTPDVGITPAGAALSITGASIPAGQTYTVDVPFTPTVSSTQQVSYLISAGAISAMCGLQQISNTADSATTYVVQTAYVTPGDSNPNNSGN